MPEDVHERARAKLTRRFQVTGRRPDGYHEIDAEMVTIDWADDLEIADGDGLEVVDTVDWSGVPTEATDFAVLRSQDNLVLRALAAARTRARVRLVKRIPHGSGLGGGSADAAAILRWAGVDDLAIAATLGADVPFCVRGGRARVGGIGERLTPLASIDLSFVVLSPALVVSTAAVYASYDEVGAPIADNGNDLEAAALAVEPRLKRYRDLLAGVTGMSARLAGSGGTWFIECPPGRGEKLSVEVRGALTEDGLAGVVVATQTAG